MVTPAQSLLFRKFSGFCDSINNQRAILYKLRDRFSFFQVRPVKVLQHFLLVILRYGFRFFPARLINFCNSFVAGSLPFASGYFSEKKR
jgi:hypothetical protein